MRAAKKVTALSVTEPCSHATHASIADATKLFWVNHTEEGRQSKLLKISENLRHDLAKWMVCVGGFGVHVKKFLGGLCGLVQRLLRNVKVGLRAAA